MRRAGRAWLLVAGVPLLAAVGVSMYAPEPAGHWSEHLAGAALKAAQLVVLAGLAGVLFRRLPSALTSMVVLVLGGIALQSLGDWRVAEAIWRSPGDPGFGSGYESGHSLSGWGDLLVLAGGIAFAVVAVVVGRLRLGAALGVAALAVIPPPFLWPGVGVTVVLLHELVGSPRARTEPASDAGRGAGEEVEDQVG